MNRLAHVVTSAEAGPGFTGKAEGPFNNFGCGGLLTVLTMLTMISRY
jgi:hypothetical protein